MKTIIIFFLLLCSISINATTYYFDAVNGNNDYNGLTKSTAWKALNKVQIYTFKDKDTLLFKRGCIFRGSLQFSQGIQIFIDAYGTGADPIFTGTTVLNPATSWTNSENDVYYTTISGAYDNVRFLIINGSIYPIGREPDNGYWYIDAYSGNMHFSSDEITGGPYDDAQAVIRTKHYIFENIEVSSISGANVTLDGPVSDINNKYGFFLQNGIKTLDQDFEWCLPSTDLFYIKCPQGKTPNDFEIQYPTSPIGLLIENAFANVSISNIHFRNYSNMGISGANIAGLSVSNCTFENIKNTAIKAINNPTLTIDIHDNKLINILSQGIEIKGKGAIYNDTLNNIGHIPGMGEPLNGKYIGILATSNGTYSGDGLLIYGNTLDNIGYNGIQFSGSFITIKENKIGQFCLVKDDGGGIYSQGSTGNGNVINNNIIGNSRYYGPSGAPDGPPVNNYEREAVGIYIDDNCANINVSANTVFNCWKGIFIHNSSGISVSASTIFNCREGILLRQNSSLNLTNCNVKHNKIFSYADEFETNNKQQAVGVRYLNTTYFNNDTISGNNIVSPFYEFPMYEEINGVRTEMTVNNFNNISYARSNTFVPLKWKNEYDIVADPFMLFRFGTSVNSTISSSNNYLNYSGELVQSTNDVSGYNSEVLVASGVENYNIDWDIDLGNFSLYANTDGAANKTIKAGSNINLYAGNEIRLTTGFHAEKGSHFRAKKENYSAVYTSDDDGEINPQLKSASVLNFEPENNSTNSSYSQLSDDHGIIVYPNPSNGIFTIKLPDGEPGYYSIINFSGQKIKEGKLADWVTKIDMQSYSKGIYLIKIEMPNGMITKSLLIE